MRKRTNKTPDSDAADRPKYQYKGNIRRRNALLLQQYTGSEQL